MTIFELAMHQLAKRRELVEWLAANFSHFGPGSFVYEKIFRERIELAGEVSQLEAAIEAAE